MNASRNQANWARLFRFACGMIREVNVPTVIIDRWTFGGGTAMMLQIDHRESHDVDLFLQNPQLLSFLDPEKRDFRFDIKPVGCSGDGTTFQKLAFEGIGEIDFIVSQPKTEMSTIQRDIEGVTTLLETLPEIVAKKIIHRGSSLKPRDIFDIAAAGEQHADLIVAGLRSYKGQVATALNTLARLNPEFVNNAIEQLNIREKFSSVAKTASERTKKILQAV